MSRRGVALVTGAGSGLGTAIAIALGSNGYTVICTGRRTGQIEAVAAGIVASGGQAEARALDVTDSAQADRVITQAAEHWGRLDVVVNNAGLFRKAVVIDMTDEDWHATIDTNLTGVFFCARAAARVMIAQDRVNETRGHLLNVNSGAGLRGYPTGAAYSASKFGLFGLSDTLRKELGPQGIKVTDVVVAAAVASDLSSRKDLQRLPAETVGKMVLDAVTMPGAAAIDRVDLSQLPLD